jgi:hypothetical protein
MFMVIFSQILVPLAVGLLKSYMNSPSSKMDYLILKNIKEGAQYLANKDNNTVDKNTVIAISNHSINEGV